MKIYIDIGHPAHVHYFRHFIKLMQQKGHEFLISARNKEVSEVLLNKYEIIYFSRGKGSSNLIGKFLYLIKTVIILFRGTLSYKPDLLISFASPYAALVSKLISKPHIAFTDTDMAKLGILTFAPLTKHILTPASFKKEFGDKQIRFKGFMELCYLHPKRYVPDSHVYEELGLKEKEPYVIFRFVSWNANHDIGQSGFLEKSKIIIVKKIIERIKVFISAEGTLPDGLETYRIKISPEKMHSVLYYATLYIGEGATMASECAMLGTPAIYVNSLTSGTIEEQERYGLLFSYRNSDSILEKAEELLKISNLKQEFIQKRDKMLCEKIDVTAFMVWFIENYPDSAKTMKENPEYQYRFK
jgi:predicted glycosyltransferase